MICQNCCAVHRLLLPPIAKRQMDLPNLVSLQQHHAVTGRQSDFAGTGRIRNLPSRILAGRTNVSNGSIDGAPT